VSPHVITATATACITPPGARSNTPHLVALVRAGARTSRMAKLGPTNQEAISKTR